VSIRLLRRSTSRSAARLSRAIGVGRRCHGRNRLTVLKIDRIAAPAIRLRAGTSVSHRIRSRCAALAS
jgi:hypothetical protein